MSETETQETEEATVPVVIFTEEQIAEQRKLLETAIDYGVQWFEYAQDGANYALMSEKEQALSRLLDPLIWSMREALVTYEHEDCEDCKVRRETGGNGYGLAVADLLLGNM